MIQLFSINKSDQLVHENIGISRIQSFLEKNNIDSELTYLSLDKGIDLQTAANIKSNIKYYGISLFYWYNNFAFELCKYIKSSNPQAVIFMGGRVITDAYRLIFDDCQHFDFAILGHGESTLVYAIKELEKGKDIYEVSTSCKHLASKYDLDDKIELFEDINNLCLPDRTYTKENLTTASIITSHGCVGNCTFCSWTKSKAKWCGRNMREVYNEIVNIYENTGIKDFMICDGSFEDPGMLGKHRIDELCGYLEEYPVKFAFKYYLRAETFKNIPSDIELLRKMRKNGFVTAYVGIEAGNNNDLLIYKKRARLEDNINIVQILKGSDIEILYGFIMINPYSTIYSIRANFEFLTRHKCQHVFNYINVLEVYYNTEFYWRMKNDSLLRKDYHYDKPHLYVCRQKDVNDIKIFLNEYFSSEKEIIGNSGVFYNNVDYFSYIKAIHNSIYNNYYPMLEVCYLKIYKLLHNYFYILYVDNNILSCIEKYTELCELLDNQYEKVSRIKNKMMRDVIRFNRDDTNNVIE